MSSSLGDNLEVNKDQTNFLHQCKDLFKYIKRKIIKIYVCPDFPNQETPISNPWSYINTHENLTEKDKCFDIFKDDTFLPLVQKCYEALENIIKRLDENRKTVEFMKKNIEFGEKKIKLLSELKTQLNSYFNNEDNEKSNGDNKGKKDRISEQLNLAKTLDILNNLQNLRSDQPNNELSLKENEIKDNVVKKIDNNIENTELTSDYSDEVKLSDNSYLLGKKREISFNDIMDPDKINNKKEKFVDISFSGKISQNNSSINSLSNNIININKQESSQYQLDFEKILKSEFSAVYLSQNESLTEQNKDYILQIKNILNKISLIKFPNGRNKFENPYLIGSHKIFDIKYLLNSIPAIDVLFKCREIKNMEEIDLITEETMSKLKLGYIEICKAYDKSSEIIKVTNKCKIIIRDNIFFIYINLFFVDVNNSSYIKKEKCFLNFLAKNKIYENEDVILICLFLRRWRRKFKLFFIMPELLDIIVYLYYNNTEKKNIALIIENIFFDLSKNQINYYNIKNNILCYFINEWYNNAENKNLINNAFSSTNEYLLKNDFLSLVKSD